LIGGRQLVPVQRVTASVSLGAHLCIHYRVFSKATPALPLRRLSTGCFFPVWSHGATDCQYCLR